MKKIPRQILQKRFGFAAFRFQQEEIINSVLAKKDTFVLMPTGGGKSLCYQIPSLVFDGLTIVISPLISLMKDQVDSLRLNGVSASFLNSTLTRKEQSEIIRLIRQNKLVALATNAVVNRRSPPWRGKSGSRNFKNLKFLYDKLKLLYIAPERIFSREMQFLDMLQSVNISLCAIDEAHCISQWGHDFRPDYLQLSILKQYFSDTPVVTLTATANTLVQKDILEKLNLKDPRSFISSFNRENIHYHVEPKQSSYDRLVNYLDSHQDDSGIIYCLSRQSVENLAADLANDGFLAKPYHAGLTKQVRSKHQDLFIKDQVKIIVATIAFGLGIDKLDEKIKYHDEILRNKSLPKEISSQLLW